MDFRRIATVVVLALLAAGTAGAMYWRSASAVSYGDITGYVFVPDLAGAEVSVLDAAYDTVVGTLRLPVRPDQFLVSNVLKRIVLSNLAAQSIYVFDLQSQTIEATYTLDFAPETVLLSPDGLLLAVAGSAAGKLAVISLYKGVQEFELEGLNRPAQMTFDGDAVTLFLSDDVAHEVKVIDIRTGSLAQPIPIDEAAAGAGVALGALTRTTSGRHGLVVDAVAGVVHVIDIARGEVAKTLPTGKSPDRAYGTSDGRLMLVANRADATVTVIDADYFEVVATLPGVADPVALATGFFESLAYVFSASENRAVVIDLEKREIRGEVALPGSPGKAVTDADGRKIYVPLSGSGRLALLDAHAMQIAKTFTRLVKSPSAPSMALTNNYCH
jgi:DNA-binding beta-propeller fold protein YncE